MLRHSLRFLGWLLLAVTSFAAPAPQVAVIEDAPWSPADFSREGAAEMAVLLRLAQLQRHDCAVGLIGVGDERGCFQAGTRRALEFAAAQGVPVVRLARSGTARTGGAEDGFIAGGRLTADEARTLLADCLRRFGPLPGREQAGARQRLLQRYQAEFDARQSPGLAVR